MKLTVIAREEMDRNWERLAVAPPPAPVSGPPLRALNLEHVMDLGNRIYFTFRGRAYGIPPLAWREGERILDAWLEAKAFGDALKREDLPAYYACIRKLQRLVWRNCRPTGPIRRLLRFLHLHRNPFRRATEGEIAELAVFMLARRMKSPEARLVPEPSPVLGT